jgi:hypothetical protein
LRVAIARSSGESINAFYQAYWAVPHSGIQSQIAFANGRIAAMILQGVKNRAARNGR